MNMLSPQGSQSLPSFHEPTIWHESGCAHALSVRNKIINIDQILSVTHDVSDSDVKCKKLVATEIQRSKISAKTAVKSDHNIRNSRIFAHRVEAKNSISGSRVHANTVRTWLIINSNIVSRKGDIEGIIMGSPADINTPSQFSHIQTIRTVGLESAWVQYSTSDAVENGKYQKELFPVLLERECKMR